MGRSSRRRKSSMTLVGRLADRPRCGNPDLEAATANTERDGPPRGARCSGWLPFRSPAAPGSLRTADPQDLSADSGSGRSNARARHPYTDEPVLLRVAVTENYGCWQAQWLDANDNVHMPALDAFWGASVADLVS